jgi:hypothetical protein
MAQQECRSVRFKNCTFNGVKIAGDYSVEGPDNRVSNSATSGFIPAHVQPLKEQLSNAGSAPPLNVKAQSSKLHDL